MTYLRKTRGRGWLAKTGTALFLVFVGGAARADTPVHESRNVAADAKIAIHNVKGEVRVSGWDQNRVQIDGTLGSGARPLQIGGDAHLLTIRVESANPSSGWFGRGDSNMGPSMLDVHVPRTAALSVDVVSAPVSVEALSGPEIDINTVSGRVHLATRTDVVHVGSVSADVELAGSARKFDVQTVSGDVQAALLNGSANAQTVSGDIALRGGALTQVDLGTVSGKVQLDAGVAPAAAWKIETMSGDVRIGLPANASAQIKADTFSGDLHSDIGAPTRGNGPGSHLGVKLGAGSGTISIDSFSGNVRIEHGTH
ncbi:MAG: DUF4097 family beta strand repeat-containing protein [Rhodanobacteraceae bacterium]